MTDLNIQDMMNAGAHFGHQTRRWNPKMKPYLYGARSGVHIIDLQQTLGLTKTACNMVEEAVARGESVLFVGTKPQAQAVIEEQAIRCNMPYITRRWLGGMLTNFVTIRRSVERLLELEMRKEKNDFAGFTKKERLGVDREISKLLESFAGIKHMKKLPGVLFVVDPSIEHIAVHEANILEIPVVAIIDSNCNPDPIDHLIPANDDALRSIQLFSSCVADSCLAGVEKYKARALVEEKQEPKKHSRKAQDVDAAGEAYVTTTDTYDATEPVESFSASVTPEIQGTTEPV